MPAAARHWNKTVPKPLVLRSGADVLSLVSGLELIPPGVVPVSNWRPDLADPAPAPAEPSEPGPSADLGGGPVRLARVQPVPVHGVVARKP
jgi:hypothetical protein